MFLRLIPSDTHAGSRLRTYGGCDSVEWRCALILCMKVVFPEPAMPTQMTAVGGRFAEVVEDAIVIEAYDVVAMVGPTFVNQESSVSGQAKVEEVAWRWVQSRRIHM